MKSSSRYRILTRRAPLPPGSPPTPFVLPEGDSYVKYGHPVFANSSQRGDPHWTAEVITQTWYQAETGRIPISGGGYGGPFAGDGFEGIWLDMSEIVRPTRDGIHGREYISTQVDLGAGMAALDFDQRGNLQGRLPKWLSLPIPILFDAIELSLLGPGAVRAIALAAEQLGILAILDPAMYTPELATFGHALVPHLSPTSFDITPGGWEPRMVEIEAESDLLLPLAQKVRQRWPDAVIALRLPLGPGAAQQLPEWVQAGFGVVHLVADELARATDGQPLAQAVRSIHTQLVEAAMRDQVTLILSGGIAAAEHVAKAIACGADLVAVDFILQVAWGCALWADRGECPVEEHDLDPNWGAQRVVNLMSAWRDQLLEALGAMGMREVRRLRGDIGRTIWNRVEEKAFLERLGGKTSKGRYRRLPEPQGAEGDLRWSVSLLQATQAQARTGELPKGDLEYRVGQSEGGFDRLAFSFELDSDPQEVPAVDPAGCDLSLPLNRRGDERPRLCLPLPWYGSGMSYGSVSLPVMLARARAAERLGIFTSTGEGGYPEDLARYADHVITQVATGLFGVREETLQMARLIEIKYAQGAKPGLGGHLLGNKNTDTVAALREAVQGTSLFSPFPFHSVYSV
jgi:hypothetical protein